MNPATSKQNHDSANSMNFGLYASALFPLQFAHQALGNISLNPADP